MHFIALTKHNPVNSKKKYAAYMRIGFKISQSCKQQKKNAAYLRKGFKISKEYFCTFATSFPVNINTFHSKICW